MFVKIHKYTNVKLSREYNNLIIFYYLINTLNKRKSLKHRQTKLQFIKFKNTSNYIQQLFDVKNVHLNKRKKKCKLKSTRDNI